MTHSEPRVRHAGSRRCRCASGAAPAAALAAALAIPLFACAAPAGSSDSVPPRPEALIAAAPMTDAADETAPAAASLEPAPAELEALVRMALGASPAVSAARARLESAGERGTQVGTLPDPRLRGRYFLEEVETRVGPQEWAVGIEQQFPALGVLDARRRTADARAEAEDSRLRATVLDVTREVKLAWYELYYLERAILTIREDLDRLRSLEEVIRRDFSAGSARYTDLIRAQVEVVRAENRLAGHEDRRKPAVARLNAALHRPVDAPLSSPLELEEPGPLLPPDELVRRMRLANPMLASLRHERTAAGEALSGAELEGRPGFSLGLEYIETGEARAPGVPDSGNDPWIATLSVDLPVHGGRYASARREARAENRAASFRLETALDQLSSELEHEQFLARDADRQIELYRETLVPRARQAFDSTETAFRGGEVSFLDLIDAERLLLDFQLSLQRARTDRAIAHAKLESLVGRPVTEPVTESGPARATDETPETEERPR